MHHSNFFLIKYCHYRIAHLSYTFSTNNLSLLMSTFATTKYWVEDFLSLHHLLMKTVVIVYEKKICVNSIKTKSLFYQFCNNNSCTIQTSIFMVYSTTFESCKIIVKIQKDFWEEGRSQKHSPMSYSFTRFSVQHAYNHSSTVFENHRKSLIKIFYRVGKKRSFLSSSLFFKEPKIRFG